MFNKQQKSQDSHLRNRYGITLEDYNLMLDEQSGCCAVCQRPPEETVGSTASVSKRRLHVDHCHRTGRVRGLLCYRCNISLAQFENPEWRFRMNQYLDGYVPVKEIGLWNLPSISVPGDFNGIGGTK